MKRLLKMKSEDEVRELIKSEKNLVVVHSKLGCPVCEYFIPEVLTPILDEFSGLVSSVIIREQLTFPVNSHPVIFFFKNGKCVQHPQGSAPEEAVREMMRTFYGKPI